MNRNKSLASIQVSEPLILDDDDMRIIRSALMATRRKSGSRRADEIIQAINDRLAYPDTHRLDLLPFE